jgi:HAD superfamily hydrolase (TIGR01509 family)
MDGLLVDSERMARSILQAAAADCGFRLSDEVYLTLIGCSPEDAETMLVEHFGARFHAPAFRIRRLVRRREILESAPVPPKPGARELLAFLSNLKMPIGLATGSSREDVRELLGDLTDVFSAIATRDDAVRPKPSPDLYLAVAASLGVEPPECLAVEDSFSGVRAASAAGMTVLMVPDLAEPTPDVARLAAGVYGSLVEVREALETWGW